jgi:transcriptional regulator with XRE-family HTH domain
MEMKVLAKRLKELREDRGYLQKFVAGKIGVKSNTLSGYENGTRTPDPDLIRSLATLYGVTTDYLLGHSDDPELTAKEDKEVTEKEKELMKKIDNLPKEERDRIINKILAYVDVETNASEE